MKITYIQGSEASNDDCLSRDIWAVWINDRGAVGRRGATDPEGFTGCVDGLAVKGTTRESSVDHEGIGGGCAKEGEEWQDGEEGNHLCFEVRLSMRDVFGILDCGGSGG